MIVPSVPNLGHEHEALGGSSSRSDDGNKSQPTAFHPGDLCSNLASNLWIPTTISAVAVQESPAHLLHETAMAAGAPSTKSCPKGDIVQEGLVQSPLSISPHYSTGRRGKIYTLMTP